MSNNGLKRGKQLKRGKRSRSGGKRSRSGGKHSKHKGYIKYKKHYTRKYGRRTRTKRGGVREYKDLKFNMSLSRPHEQGSDDVVHGKGFALVTQLNADGSLYAGAAKEELQQMIILQQVSNKKRHKFRIYKCPVENCEGTMKEEIHTNKFTIN